ncbi:DUF3575 domain-containing protein [Hymenobacter glacieicola]|uniref:DUF3575 domain-containing protein n=1 Tax=Hymenobacter glacieicola TaxID=1562124 RepID=A0ABQ1WMB9_9BACT|nr:DUF3575 domain-containing protein [Hymenobacter glacieicola]GGG37754.1 hypothetical protein GCM10011378_12550 [Hymenobacter glacieicola]
MFSPIVRGLLVAGALLACSRAHAQTNVLKIDIFQPIVNTAALSFEHKLSESSSFQLGVSITANYNEEGGSWLYGASESRKTSGFGLMPEYRFYLSEKHPAMEGFYVAPFLRYQYLSQSGQYEQFNPNTGISTTRTVDASLNAFGGGVVVGRHWIFKQRFSLDALLGPSYMISGVSSDNSDISKNDFLGFYDDINYGIRGAVTFGVAF